MKVETLTIQEESHRRVLNLIRQHKEISGAELSRLTGLRPSTMVYILRFLEGINLIRINGTGESTKKGGKKPTLWKINEDVGYIIGLELLKNKTRYVLCNFAGNCIQKEEFKHERIVSSNAVSELKGQIEHIMHTGGLSVKNVLGAGLALPGLIDQKNGQWIYSSLFKIKDIGLVELLEGQTGIPVEIGNDANAGAKGIKWFPESAGYTPSNIVYITYNQRAVNIGAGLIINDMLYDGSNGMAGEILSPIPALKNLIKKGVRALGKNHPLLNSTPDENELELKDIYEHYHKGCALSEYILRNISDFISDEILRIIGWLNPQLIVLGGGISVLPSILNEYIQPGIEKKIKRFFGYGYSIPEIRFSPFGDYSVAMGAAALIYSKILG